jgi:hypothetical protein
LRQTTGFVDSLLRLVGLDWRVPGSSTLSRRPKTLAVNIPYRGSRDPLHLLVDSTGIKVEGEGEWHGASMETPSGASGARSISRSTKTLEGRAREIIGSHIGDAPVLPDLLGQILPDEKIGSVTADGAYDTRNCHNAIADRSAHAVIPPRKNARHWKPATTGAIVRNEALRASKYLGRAICRNWSGYNRWSRAETKMHCMKLLGQRLMARAFERQVAEVQAVSPS